MLIVNIGQKAIGLEILRYIVGIFEILGWHDALLHTFRVHRAANEGFQYGAWKQPDLILAKYTAKDSRIEALACKGVVGSAARVCSHTLQWGSQSNQVVYPQSIALFNQCPEQESSLG